MKLAKLFLDWGPGPSLDGYRALTPSSQRLNGERRTISSAAPSAAVVTVVRNARDTLQRTIDSVRAQAYPAIEYIIVDGGSTDGTIDLIRANEDVVTHWFSEPDRGIYDAFNKGVAAVRSDFVTILNADDWMEPNHIESAMRALSENGADFTFGDIWLHGWQGQDVFIPGDPDYAATLRRDMPRLYQTTALCRISMFEKIGMFRTSMRIAADYEWFIRADIAGLRGVHTPEIVGHMAAGGISTTRQRLALLEGFVASVRNGYPLHRATAHWSGRAAALEPNNGFIKRISSNWTPTALRQRFGTRAASTSDN